MFYNILGVGRTAPASLWWTQATPTPLFTVTSLGPLVCPSAYYVASQNPINSLTTFTACCPSGYSFSGIAPAGTYGSECTSTFTSGYTWTYYAAEATTGPRTLTTTLWGSGPAGLVHAVALNGYNFAETTSSTSSSSSITSPSVSSSTSSSTSASESSSNSGSTGLSTGAKAGGIGVGVTLGILGTCFALGAWYYIRKNLRKSTSPAVAAGDGDTGGNYRLGVRPELEALSSQPLGARYKDVPDATLQHELDSQHPVQEMDARG
ncbi:uncharacterized protein PAC_02245 [Phialocephala subalpina]|uniref:Uncharacterized protein n=1 Tax=Phialocephala subalpina TaxID=576137 RepID=A0A1L7WHW9_9HELO|nr:uncharacterized protein PAC_02245 [Phialocephala subalpina]